MSRTQTAAMMLLLVAVMEMINMIVIITMAMMVTVMETAMMTMMMIGSEPSSTHSRRSAVLMLLRPFRLCFCRRPSTWSGASRRRMQRRPS